MGYRNLRETVNALLKSKQLVQIAHPIDPYLEAAEIQRRLFEVGGPACLMTNVQRSRFPILANLFGTRARVEYLFRDEITKLRALMEWKAHPDRLLKHPWNYWKLVTSLYQALPRSRRRGSVLECQTNLADLPQIQSWPRDGGAFVTLPLVYTEHPDFPGWRKSNLGMYRVQISGNQYTPDECGLHYQIHRGIGVHHAAAIRKDQPLNVNVVVGGPPALTLAAVMPLPEGMPEMAFAGVLAGHRLTLTTGSGPLSFPAEADFVIQGTIDPHATKPEGPFGDHLGYYSLQHEFPVMKVTAVYHRKDAIWPFTVVGRPPQEDTIFGEWIHDLTDPVIPTVLPGVKAVHAVDAAGVHPLLLAIGSERYVPYAERRQPQELLTQASAILGQGQLSLAKYLLIVAHEDDRDLDIHDIPRFFQYLLERVDWQRDLHFHTNTTIDTLDYSAGMGLNAGSKVVLVAAGPKRRELRRELPALPGLPDGFRDPRLAAPGILVITGPKATPRQSGEEAKDLLPCMQALSGRDLEGWPLIVIADDSDFTARNWNNLVWVTFTRSDPAHDIHGVGSFIRAKHWGCQGSLVIDARWKPHMAPPLEADPAVSRRVDALATRGGPLHGIL